MKKNILIIFIISLFGCAAFANLPNNKQLDNIEKQLFGYSYEQNSELKRMIRIEEYLYGTDSSGTITKRLNKVNNDLGITEKIAQKESNKDNEKITYEKEDDSVSYPIVDEMENKIFSKTYNGENIYNRVSRLEKQLYKESNDKDSLSNRVNHLRLSIFKTNLDDKMTANNDSITVGDNIYNDYQYASPQKSKEEYFNMELTSLEKVILNASYSTDSVVNRLNRLESKIFQRNFTNDSSNERLERIAAATSARKSSKQYDDNKLMKGLSTGAQIGSILLLILAMIL